MVPGSAEENGRQDREARVLQQQEVNGCRFYGKPLAISYLPELTAWRGKLLTNQAALRGTPVLAGSFLRERRIVFDTELLGDPRELERVQLHELFHFAWIRLSNAGRASWTQLLALELSRGARGELGWSSEWRKNELTHHTSPRFFRDYVCESFCDTAAWRYGSLVTHEEFTLAARWRKPRGLWFDRAFPERKISI